MIGESDIRLGKRRKAEHNTTSAVSEHLKSTQHHFDSEKVEILAKEPKDYSRKILEAIQIRQNNPSLSRDKGLELDPFWDRVLLYKEESNSKLETPSAN